MRATALVLDPTHRCLTLGDELPAFHVPPGVRPLAALLAAAERELDLRLPGPLGGRVASDGALFLFLASVPPGAATTAARVPLRAWARDPRRAGAWSLYVQAMLGGWEPPTRELEVFYFGNEPALAARLAHLVVKGDKRATTGWVAGCEREGETVPSPGLVSIVTDGFGVPLCAIRSLRVEHKRFGDAGDDIARAEAEGDRTLEDWREGHLRYFQSEAARLGMTFDEDAEIFHEHFEVVRVLGRAP